MVQPLCVPDLPCDSATAFQGIQSKDSISYYRYTCSSTFIAVLFTMTRTWKQPECPSTGEWIIKMWYLYTVGLYSAVKKL